MSVRTTPFVQDATTGKRVTHGWLAYILVFVVGILAVQAGVGAVFASVWAVTPGTPAAQLQEAITFAAALVFILLWVVLFERRSVASMGFRRPGHGVVTMLLGILIGIALISIPTLLLLLTGAYKVVEAPAGASAGAAAVPLLLLLLVFVLIQGGTEEVLTRGFLLQNQGLKLPGWLAILLPAVIFTVIHGVALKPLAFASILFYALLASFLVLRLGSLWLVIGLHAGWNFAMGNIYGIAVSGLPARSTSLLFLEPTAGAPDWITGGEFGTEGSLAADITLFIAALIAFLVFRSWDKKRTHDTPIAAPTTHSAPATAPQG
ncbi:CPBP family glutamic-type intramembrane protease [Microbacterium sp. A196]|uniref:CPBP family glutamic-type intramembrane protease n=1 Tax=unclassified Microbacterium TaxID=2609290 RepID=UPI003FD5FB4E